MIQIIDCQNVRQYNETEITEEMAGRKALGLLKVPCVWRLPFFVIHREVMTAYVQQTPDERIAFISDISNRIRDCVEQWSFPKVNNIIIRSSGMEEGMSERGKYDSKDCQISFVEKTLQKLFDELNEAGYEPIAYIIQPFLERRACGHLSNERRVSKDARDWKFEFETPEHEGVYSLSIRRWRTVYDLPKIRNDILSCTQIKNIKSALRKIAYFYTESKHYGRVHLEFVWDGTCIFIVQYDIEQCPKDGVNPKKLQIEKNMEELERLRFFRPVDMKEEDEFPKIKNVIKYDELELPTVPFYILKNRKVIEELANGVVCDELKEDIELLVSHSIVVRTDVSINEQADRQLLPRSNELRSFQAFKEWAGSRLLELLQYKTVILLVHVFIPAVSAAFAYASPNNRIVTIQSLWGLPEGLYYNTHDTTQVDTGTRYVSHMDWQKISDIRSRSNYKAFFYAPDSSGKWKEMSPLPPYDWQMSISEQQAKYIAWASRLIAQSENSSLSIMWFVGLDQKYYNTDCLPWYHEEIKKNTFVHDIYQKKHYTQREELICCEEDLYKIKNVINIGAITIHPQNDSVLRDKDFLKKVGEFALQKNVAIFLEGTILAHPVYRLISQGVKVVLTDTEKILFGWEHFNKLVRDKIPEKIQNNMENIKCYSVKEEWLIRYLKEKLVEEAYEVLDAETHEERLEELADVYEVTEAIRKLLKEVKSFKIVRANKDLLEKEAIPIHQIVVEDLAVQVNHAEYAGKYPIDFCLERSHQELELELRFLKNYQKTNSYSYKELTQYKKFLHLAYLILDTDVIDGISQLCEEIFIQIDYICQELGETTDKIREIAENKQMKNGGFQKGYVLKETSKNFDEDINKFSDSIYAEEDCIYYPELKELLFSPVTYVDYRKTMPNELIIRIRYHLCLKKWSHAFSGDAISQMFGLDCKIYVIAERVCEKYIFSIYLGEKNYQQMILDL